MSSLYRLLDKRYRIARPRTFRLNDYDPAEYAAAEFAPLASVRARERADVSLERNRRELAHAQELLWASDTYSVLLVFQAMDAAGKDGTIKHVMSGLNPQGCDVHSFKRPSAADLDHNFLWRYWSKVPERGRFGIFNRSYYEEVLVVRVHPEVLAAQRVPTGRAGAGFWQDRFDDINRFERHLARNGTVVLKFFLHVSKSEQRRRLLARIDDPKKRWKFSPEDLREREFWPAYRTAYEKMIAATSTSWAPWYVIPADHKHVCRAVVAELLVGRVGELGLKYPVLPKAQRAALASARQRLLAER